MYDEYRLAWADIEGWAMTNHTTPELKEKGYCVWSSFKGFARGGAEPNQCIAHPNK
jgi:hypothetical protein